MGTTRGAAFSARLFSEKFPGTFKTLGPWDYTIPPYLGYLEVRARVERTRSERTAAT
jgi:hypothetical protein